MGKIGDDLFPPVRALGAMQIVLALGIGLGAMMVGKMAWDATVESRDGKIIRVTLVAACGVLVIVGLVLVWTGTFANGIDAAVHAPFDRSADRRASRSPSRSRSTRSPCSA